MSWTFEPSAAKLGDLSGTFDTTDLTDGDGFVWDEASGLLKPGAAGGAVAVDDGGTEVVAEASRLNFGANLGVTDDGAGTVTITGAAAGGSFSELVGDGTATSFDVAHALDTTDVVVVLYDLTGTDPQLATADADGVLIIDADTVRVVFAVAPAADAYRVVVLASGAATNGGGSGPSPAPTQVRFSEVVLPLSGTQLVTREAFWLRFACVQACKLIRVRAPIAAATANVRIRVVRVTGKAGDSTIVETLYTGTYAPVTAPVLTDEALSVELTADTLYAVVFEQESGSGLSLFQAANIALHNGEGSLIPGPNNLGGFTTRGNSTLSEYVTSRPTMWLTIDPN